MSSDETDKKLKTAVEAFSKLKRVETCTSDFDMFVTFDILIDLIELAKIDETTKSKFGELFDESLTQFFHSNEFKVKYLLSKDEFIRHVSSNLVAMFLVLFEHSNLMALILDWSVFGLVTLDVFELVLRQMDSQNSPLVNSLTTHWQNMCRDISLNVDHPLSSPPASIKFRSTFYVFDICLSIDTSEMFYVETVTHWSTYSALFATVLTLDDKSCWYEGLKVLNRLLTLILEKIVIKKPIEENVVKIANAALKFSSHSHTACVSSCTYRWFGGQTSLDQQNDPNCLGEMGDPCFLRTCILVQLKSNLVLKVKNQDSAQQPIKVFITPGLTCCSDFVELFLDQDDQLCELFIINLFLSPKNVWNCHELFLSFLHSINWSYDVLLDWIISQETIFLSFFTRYLKFSITDLSNLRQNSKSLPVKISPTTTTTSDIDGSCEHPTLQLRIVELLGDTEHSKDVTIRPLLMLQRTSNQPPNNSTSKNVDVSGEFLECLRTLNRKLQTLNEKRLTPFNAAPLLKLLTQLIDSFQLG